MKVFPGKKNLEIENLNLYLQENIPLYLFPIISLVFINASKSIDSFSPTKIALLVPVTGSLQITATSGVLLQKNKLLLLVVSGVFVSVPSLPLFFTDTLVLLNFSSDSRSNAVYLHFIYLILILLVNSQGKTAEGTSNYLLNELAKRDPEPNERGLNLEILSKKLPK